MNDPSRPSNLVPSVVILIGLSFAGLGTLPRPMLSDPFDDETILDEYYTGLDAAGTPGYRNGPGEPSLWVFSHRDGNEPAFRFLWSPSFDHPLSIWIVRTDGGARLRAVVLDGLGGYEAGHVAIDKTVNLSKSQWKALENLVEQSSFWEMPTRIDDQDGTDGDTYMVEGVGKSRYHVVNRWEPKGPYLQLCGYMVDLSGLRTRRPWEHDTSPASP